MNLQPRKEKKTPTEQWVRETRLFRRWEQVKREINKHKWYESEKAGHDIGWDRAAVDWMMRHGPRDGHDEHSD